MPTLRPPHLQLDTLSAPLEALLNSGGDSRLNLDPASSLNRYGCQAKPRPELLPFASSTASNISSRGFAAATAMRHQLVAARDLPQAFGQQTEWLRNQLRTILHFDRSVEIVFSPSGTDSEISALFVAQTVLNQRSPNTGPFVNVIVAADETGSGVPNAVLGRHFSSATAPGGSVLQGATIAGFPVDTTSIAISIREPDGPLRSSADIDNAVIAAVARSVAAGQRVILHAMDCSKFGSYAPSFNCLRHVQENWRGSVQVVIDACQFRTSRRRLTSFLEYGFLVLITGSKFFAGPPFSGALLVPPSIAATLRRSDVVPRGLELYSNRHDWPLRWHGIRNHLPASANLGQLLRWAAAVAELRAYFDIPASYRSLALQMFSAAVERLLLERPNLQLLPAFGEEEMAARTIFPFCLRRSGDLLSLEECQHIYRALQGDASHLLPRSATAAQRQSASQPCQIGQPVPNLDAHQNQVGTLRISASARLASESWDPYDEAASLKRLEQHLQQLPFLFQKIDLLLENLDSLSGNPVPLQLALADAAARMPVPVMQPDLVASSFEEL